MKRNWGKIRRFIPMYLMLLPAILYYIIFCYVPMYGVTIAFKDFNPMLGIWKSSVGGDGNVPKAV